MACGSRPWPGTSASASAPPKKAIDRQSPEMRNLVLLVIIGILGWQGYQHLRSPSAAPAVLHEPSGSVLPAATATPAQSATFRCDGRTRCSQMTSCEEATFFLRNCPGVKMDGDNDGVPCEQQWCRK
ncbi:MAG TPA: excalibur calcium-binding domain-containing protein [Burkholderiaceae bacterium]|nr:excalibur calcium-binding domain-containing protein [Burkholderiaceae bacterium]